MKEVCCLLNDNVMKYLNLYFFSSTNLSNHSSVVFLLLGFVVPLLE